MKAFDKFVDERGLNTSEQLQLLLAFLETTPETKFKDFIALIEAEERAAKAEKATPAPVEMTKPRLADIQAFFDRDLTLKTWDALEDFEESQSMISEGRGIARCYIPEAEFTEACAILEGKRPNFDKAYGWRYKFGDGCKVGIVITPADNFPGIPYIDAFLVLPDSFDKRHPNLYAENDSAMGATLEFTLPNGDTRALCIITRSLEPTHADSPRGRQAAAQTT